MSLVSVSGGTHGSVALISNGTWVGYTPNTPDPKGTDSFIYTVKDNSNNLQASGTVTLNVAAQQAAQITSISSASGEVTHSSVA